MIEELRDVTHLEPSAELDARVRRRLREAIEAQKSPHAAPFLPMERLVYALVVVTYAVYTAASAVQLF